MILLHSCDEQSLHQLCFYSVSGGLKNYPLAPMSFSLLLEYRTFLENQFEIFLFHYSN
jgi:hypothetical protein